MPDCPCWASASGHSSWRLRWGVRRGAREPVRRRRRAPVRRVGRIGGLRLMAVRAETVRRLALSLPETAEAPHHDMTSFRVAGKIFATMPPEGGRVHVFLDEDEVAAYCAELPGAVEEL